MFHSQRMSIASVGSPTSLALVFLVGLLVSQPAAAKDVQQLFIRAIDATGTPVPDLTAEEIIVQQGGMACEIVMLQPETEGMKIAFLVDNNAPTRTLNPFRDGLLAFVDTLPEGHTVGVFTLAGQTRRRVDFTTDYDELREFANDVFMEANSSTVMLNGLTETWERYDEDDAWPVFVMLLHDGPDVSSGNAENMVQRLQAEWRQRGATVHAVVFATGRMDNLTQLSRNIVAGTGGIHSRIDAFTALPDTMTELANGMAAHYETVGNAYRVGFTCDSEEESDNTSIGVSRPGVNFSAFGHRGVQ